MAVATTIANIFTSNEAAEKLGIAPSMVCKYCREGRLPAEKVGRDWIIKREALERFAKEPREPGNPNFGKH